MTAGIEAILAAISGAAPYSAGLAAGGGARRMAVYRWPPWRGRLLLHHGDRMIEPSYSSSKGTASEAWADDVGGVRTAAIMEGDHDEITALIAQCFAVIMPIRPIASGSPAAGTPHEREDQRHHQRQVFATLGSTDLRGLGPAGLLHAERERTSIGSTRKYTSIDPRRRRTASRSIGQERAALVLVEAGRYDL